MPGDLKHEYFNYHADKGSEVHNIIRLDKGLLLEIAINDTLMAELLKRPIPSLVNLPWGVAFQRRLENARDEKKAAPDFIIVTGGAARMGFLLELVARVFPKAKVVRGKEPEFAIATGLAWFDGRTYCRASSSQLSRRWRAVRRSSRLSRKPFQDCTTPSPKSWPRPSFAMWCGRR